MKQIFWILCIGIFVFGCNDKSEERDKSLDLTSEERNAIVSVEIKDLIVDSTLNVRAIELDSELVIGISSLGKKYMVFIKENDTLFELETIGNANSRASALQNGIFFNLSIETPARLYKDGMLVYYEDHPKAFYDSMDFWNDNEGIAIGDPTEDCMSIIITRDGGDTWNKLDCSQLPKAMEGEAAFAASDTNIAIVGDHTWVATGGKASRVMYSPDKGQTWEVFDTPIIQGKETTGIFSIDFYDELNGFAIGGDYTDPDANFKTKIRTGDGGETWELVTDGQNPGYRSCVQYIPNSNAKELIAVGFKGIDYSADSGENWNHLSDEGFYTIRFLNDSIAYAAGQGRICKLIFARE